MTDKNFDSLMSVTTPEGWVEKALSLPQTRKKPLLRPYLIGTAASLVFAAAVSVFVFMSTSQPSVPVDSPTAAQSQTLPTFTTPQGEIYVTTPQGGTQPVTNAAGEPLVIRQNEDGSVEVVPAYTVIPRPSSVRPIAAVTEPAETTKSAEPTTRQVPATEPPEPAETQEPEKPTTEESAPPTAEPWMPPADPTNAGSPEDPSPGAVEPATEGDVQCTDSYFEHTVVLYAWKTTVPFRFDSDIRYMVINQEDASCYQTGTAYLSGMDYYFFPNVPKGVYEIALYDQYGLSVNFHYVTLADSDVIL